MDTMPGTTMRADARRNRERLITAALAAFTERGSDDTSLEEIARRAGVGIGTLYRHFPTRQALLEAVYRDQMGALCARARELAADPSPQAALIRWLRDLVQFGLAKRSLTAELLAAPAGMNAPVFAACRTELTETGQVLLTRAQEAGAARPGLTVSDLSRLSHAIVVATEKAPAPDRAREADRLLDILLGGVLTVQQAPGQPAATQSAAGQAATGQAGGPRTAC